jgi:phenylacetic acid degradation operon negative regulatory protein
LLRLGVTDSLVVLSGKTLRNEAGMRRLAHDCWSLAELDAGYTRFVTMFRPLVNAVPGTLQVNDKTAFIVRTLLIQEYRTILLRDPLLPQELLPSAWQGTAAFQLCGNLYRTLHGSADRYLSESMETADGPLPPPGAAFWQRFGGLEHG